MTDNSVPTQPTQSVPVKTENTQDTNQTQESVDSPIDKVTKDSEPALGLVQTSQAEKDGQAPSNNEPDKLKDKSRDEIVSMYLNLESEFGKRGTELNGQKKDMEEMQGFISKFKENPEKLFEQNQQIQQQELKVPESKVQTKEESSEESNSDPKVEQMRNAFINTSISDFKKNFGIEKLSKEKSDSLMQKITDQFADLADPSGTKNTQQILAEMDVNNLSKTLENAFWLVQKDTLKDGGPIDPDLSSIGGMSANLSTGGSGGSKLTAQELKVANSLGVSEEDYLKNK